MDNTVPLRVDCLIKAFTVLAHFILTTESPALHFSALDTYIPPDIRLHDYSLRYQLHLTCLSQTFRTVFAAQHVAQEYQLHTQLSQEFDMEAFADKYFDGCNVQEIEALIRDGQRLLYVESLSGSPWTPFVLALDWQRFQKTSYAGLVEVVRSLIEKPSFQGLCRNLSWDWMKRAFTCYHNQVLDYRLNPTQQRELWLKHAEKRCPNCIIFLCPITLDTPTCVSCARGGFICHNMLAEQALVRRHTFAISIANELRQLTSASCTPHSSPATTLQPLDQSNLLDLEEKSLYLLRQLRAIPHHTDTMRRSDNCQRSTSLSTILEESSEGEGQN